MTITREQLALAAKAAGITDADWHGFTEGFWSEQRDEFWNPLTDHGQLLDFAMACKIRIDPILDEIVYRVTGNQDFTIVLVDCQDFPALAEAVITAAAEQQLAKEKKG